MASLHARPLDIGGSVIARVLLLLGLVLPALPIQAEPASKTHTAVIATRNVPPFSILTDGGWSGIAIDLVRRIAEEQGLELEFREMGLSQMLEAVAQGEVTAAAAALTITAQREQRVDFTHPFFSSGLGIALPLRKNVTWLHALKRMFSGPFLHSLAALLGVLSVLGLLVWLAERRHNAHFPRHPVKGIGAGIWWSAVTMTTVGYGDKAPITPLGRVVGLVWMFASVIMISGFTAAIATSLTLGELDHTVAGIKDLYDKRVLTTEGSTSDVFLTEKLVRHRTVADAPTALEALAAGEADAVVYDAPILRYLVREHYSGRLRVLPTLLSRQDYGIALPPGSPKREAINQRLLEIIRSPEWERMVASYLGENEG
jgi:polar amino acid transport system substrate-binding protein